MIDRKILIILTADEKWGDVWHTQLYWADRLAERYQVIYIEPPLPWKPGSVIKIKPQIRNIKPGLFVYTYHNPLPAGKLKKISLKYNDLINNALLKPLLKGFNEVILWQFDTHRMLDLTGFNGVKRIYHVVDAYMGNKNDEYLAQSADLIIHTSPKYHTHYQSLNSNLLQLPQGFESSYYMHDQNRSEEYLKKYGDYFFLSGSIIGDINFDLLTEIATRFKSYNLVIVGPDLIEKSENKIKFQKLIDLENVHYLGRMHASLINSYVVSAKVCLVAYNFIKEENIKLTRSPLKVISYLAFGKPVISSIPCEIPSLEEKLIYLSTDLENYIDQLSTVLEKDHTNDLKIAHEYLESVHYNKLIDQAMNALVK